MASTGSDNAPAFLFENLDNFFYLHYYSILSAFFSQSTSIRGTVPLPFKGGANKRVAVKIIDDRGIESLKIMEVR